MMSKKQFGNIDRNKNLGGGGGLNNLLNSPSQREEKFTEPSKQEIKEKIKPVNSKPKSKIPDQPVKPKQDEKEEEKKGTIDEKENNNSKTKKDYITKTFNLLQSDLDTVTQFITYKRMQGDIRFTQKNAFTEMLDLLRNAINKNSKVIPIDNRVPEGDKLKSRSFNVLMDDFAFIEEVIKIRRMGGQTNFTQRNVITESLNILRSKHPNLKN